MVDQKVDINTAPITKLTAIYLTSVKINLDSRDIKYNNFFKLLVKECLIPI